MTDRCTSTHGKHHVTNIEDSEKHMVSERISQYPGKQPTMLQEVTMFMKLADRRKWNIEMSPSMCQNSFSQAALVKSC
jgi:hypothetical protein